MVSELAQDTKGFVKQDQVRHVGLEWKVDTKVSEPKPITWAWAQHPVNLI